MLIGLLTESFCNFFSAGYGNIVFSKSSAIGMCDQSDIIFPYNFCHIFVGFFCFHLPNLCIINNGIKRFIAITRIMRLILCCWIPFCSDGYSYIVSGNVSQILKMKRNFVHHVGQFKRMEFWFLLRGWRLSSLWCWLQYIESHICKEYDGHSSACSTTNQNLSIHAFCSLLFSLFSDLFKVCGGHG